MPTNILWSPSKFQIPELPISVNIEIWQRLCLVKSTLPTAVSSKFQLKMKFNENLSQNVNHQESMGYLNSNINGICPCRIIHIYYSVVLMPKKDDIYPPIDNLNMSLYCVLRMIQLSRLWSLIVNKTLQPLLKIKD